MYAPHSWRGFGNPTTARIEVSDTGAAPRHREEARAGLVHASAFVAC